MPSPSIPPKTRPKESDLNTIIGKTITTSDGLVGWNDGGFKMFGLTAGTSPGACTFSVDTPANLHGDDVAKVSFLSVSEAESLADMTSGDYDENTGKVDIDGTDYWLTLVFNNSGGYYEIDLVKVV